MWFTQLLFYGLPWLTWNGRQLVLFDLQARRFHFFGVTFTPHDFIYLALLLAICALALFLFTAVAGRLWCGYACPQTVYTEIFLWVERRVEGDRNQRMKRDRGPRNIAWWGHKLVKHGAWIFLSVWTGFTFVGFFTPIRTLGTELFAFSLGPWETFWILFYGFATYGNAGWLREKVCTYMCPYARFQGVMFDQDTLVIGYDTVRGDPRGSRSRKATAAEHGLGDCIDCGLCVHVCPTGIDIRDGLQYECIGCAACIDACNGVMDKMGYARGLIRYGTGSGLSLIGSGREVLARLRRPRVLVYTAILGALVAICGVGLWQHTPLKADVLRDRSVLVRSTADGGLENLYRLHLTNASEQPMTLKVGVEGLPGISLPADEMDVVVPPQQSVTHIVHAQLAPDHNVPAGSHPIVFVFQETRHDGTSLQAPSSFIIAR